MEERKGQTRGKTNKFLRKSFLKLFPVFVNIIAFLSLLRKFKVKVKEKIIP
jgi:hypothetical protein